MEKLLVGIMCLFALSGCQESGSDGAAGPGVFYAENTIRAKIFVSDIPETITLDHEEAEDTTAEYIWRVTFDVNQDGIVGAGDLVFQISEAKYAGEVERIVKLTDLEASLLRHEDENSLVRQAVIDFEVDNTGIAFIVDRSLHENLKDISLTTQVNVEVYKNIPSQLSIDYLPDSQTFTQLQSTASVSDDMMDYYGDDAGSDISKFTLEIFE